MESIPGRPARRSIHLILICDERTVPIMYHTTTNVTTVETCVPCAPIPEYHACTSKKESTVECGCRNGYMCRKGSERGVDRMGYIITATK
jgi:hypothetical protein